MAPRRSLLIAMLALTAVAAQGAADNEVTRLLERMDVMPPTHYRGLTIFPLEMRGSENGADYASLDEAFRGGFIRVSDTGVVERVTMANTSRSRWVFAMAGEVILGGKQNRMLRQDVALAPGVGPVTVPTYCVEQRRWAGAPTAKFGAGGAVSNYALRRKALGNASQAEVWGQVDAEQQRFRVPSATKDYDKVAKSPAVARALDEYRRAYVSIWRPRTVGFVVAQGNRIVAADAFCNTRLFLKLRNKLVNSYAFDCVGRHRGIRPTLRQQDARDFMARIYGASFTRATSPGSGEKLDFRANGAEGSALTLRNAVIHLHATPGYTVRPIPAPHPGPGLPVVPRERE
ncbi:hypothetical protein HQ560_11170 [bacterium]|nr:hypothetical protein [bacterium]